MTLTLFHPAVAAWFRETFPAPTACQQKAWSTLKAGHPVLIAAPTGSGKTLAAFLAAIDRLVRKGIEGRLADVTEVLYISPLKALSNDVQRNLERPLEGIGGKLFELDYPKVIIRSCVRTGDTPSAVRTAMSKRPPHILVTTPESFYILLTSESGRRLLKTVRTVIVDEIHALVNNKRGAHLALSLERLEKLTGSLVRIGLSATQRPIEEVARFLLGCYESGSNGFQNGEIIDMGHRRQLDLAIELPDSPLEAVLSQQAAGEIYDRLSRLIEHHRTTLIFVNTRRSAERVARALSERVGEKGIASHHGSLAREQRLLAEARLKAGQLKALVATASLELGIDIGEVDLVCQLGTTGSIATLLQRVGRSGHSLEGLPKGRLFPTSRDELIECIALIDAVRRGELEHLTIPAKPLDVLAQQLVAMVSCEEWSEDELYRWVRRAYPYRALTRQTFDKVIQMLTEGFNTRRGRRSAYLHRDAIHKRLRARRGARLTAITCGGAIPDTADYRVILEPGGELIGTVDEDFAMESLAGDIFQLGNASWRVLRLENGILRVEDAQGQPPTIPFWFGEAPGRTEALSYAVSRLREAITGHCQESIATASSWLKETIGISPQAAEQAVNYIAAAQAALGAVPCFHTLVFERFFDEAGGLQFIIHAPFGSRLNRAWGLALRKRFCRTFNFELQAAATENAILLSLGTSQSFPLEEAAHYLRADTVRDLLVQALLDAPMFTIRWRWNAACALALKRFQGGKKTPPYLLRMQAEDLVSCVFPDQLACLENISGDREIPDHPLVQQTIADCLVEAMDSEGLIEVLKGIEKGTIRVVARDLVEPSPLAAEVLNSKVHTFLDGAPLEERRARAVTSRRWLDPATAQDLGRLDPAAIARVREEAWPEAESPDECHDALTLVGFVEEQEGAPWQVLFHELITQGRAARLPLSKSKTLWIAAERLPLFNSLYPTLQPEPILQLPIALTQKVWEREAALTEIIRARLSGLGPVRVSGLAESLNLPPHSLEPILLKLEGEGFVLRGRFTPDAEELEWCERGLLARIHRYTIKKLRKEIEPVSSADFMRFLFCWQHLSPEYRLQGAKALSAVVEQLEGFEAAASAWEGDILPTRLEAYEPGWLDALCLSGKIRWCRLTASQKAQAPLKSSPLTFIARRHLQNWRIFTPQPEPASRPISGSARRVIEILAARGALFFEELAEESHLLKSQLESALAESVAKGLISSDSFNGLRALLVPEQKKRQYERLAYGMEEAGRWSLLVNPEYACHSPLWGQPDGNALPANGDARDLALDHCARVLLKRYGIIFRALLTRESTSPPWQDLLRLYRRWEARGEIRGGRFVAGHYGEQFALPEAVEALRALRKQQDDEALITVNGADPLNLVGIITPGGKVSALAHNRILYRGGIPLAVQSGKETRFLKALDERAQWEIKTRLIRRSAPLAPRAYPQD